METGGSATKVLRSVLAVAVLLIVVTPARGTTPGDGGATQPPTGRPGDAADSATLVSSAPCAAPCEPNDPSPAQGATNVPVDMPLSWNVPAPQGCESFRIVASTGGVGQDLNPFSLVELAIDPARETAVDVTRSIGFVSSLDFSPGGLLYGMDGGLCRIDTSNGSAQTICPTLSMPDGSPVSLTGIAFHPDGTLYGVGMDLEADQNVFYTIDMGTCVATEVSRTSTARGDVWGIDFSPDGVLYGAFCELVKFDLAKGMATIVGRRFSLPFVNDIDYAPDGFIYAVDIMQWRLYKINPATGLLVDEYGPYDSELWGVASECLLPSCSARTTGALVPLLSAASMADRQTPSEPAWLRHATAEELIATAQRGFMLERVISRGEETPAADGAGAVAAGAASPLLQAAAAEVGSDITCDVYLDTVRPPLRLVGRDVPPPAAGEMWSCGHRALKPGTVHYWRVVAKRPCGAITVGPVWSFTTKSPPAQETAPSTTIPATK
jgi:hypothetical protein